MSGRTPHRERLEAAAAALDVRTADAHVAVLAKPAGMLVHRGWGRDEVVLLNAARCRFARHVYPVHRLDRGTSGAIAITFAPETARAMQEAFGTAAVEKRYLALVRNVPSAEHGVVDTPLRRTPDGPRVPSRTRWARLATLHASALVLAMPETGRLHQVRRHLRDLGHPVIGDKEHGGGRHSRWLSEKIGLERMALHALALAFPHPAGEGRVSAVAPLGPDLVRPLERLGADLASVLAAASTWTPPDAAPPDGAGHTAAP